MQWPSRAAGRFWNIWLKRNFPVGDLVMKMGIAAFGLEAFEGAARGGVGASAAEWTTHDVSDKCGGDPSTV